MRFATYCIVWIAVACVCCSSVAAEPGIDEKPIVLTGLGRIQGSVLKSRLGRNFYAFRGIRYGVAPVGERRFKAPEPVDQWTGVYNATDDGPMCVQIWDDYTKVSEDCLMLNVYSHSVDGPHENRTAQRKPVLMYIYPGGFYFGSGHSKTFAGPQNLMDRDVVLVTFNYRMGTLGMVATGTKDYPGNAGLKDQVLVLKWIKAHIANFGGDPNLVTIMGYSAGAWSVSMHMVSPMSTGLFHRAIVMSGAITSQWDIPPHQLHIAEREARIHKCPTDSVDSMMNCMKTIEASEFGKSLSKMFEFKFNPVLIWSPVVEPDFGQERFLPDDPTRLFRLGRIARVPVLAGITELEFASPSFEIMRDPAARQQMDSNWTEMAPLCFQYERHTNRSEYISNALRSHFINGSLVDVIGERSEGLEHLFADSLIGFGMHRFVRLASLFTRVYYYKNSYVGRYSHFYVRNNTPLGTVHHDDLLYLFVLPLTAPMFKVSDPENLQVERMTRIWTSFAQRGDPNNRGDELLKDLRWRPMQTTRLNYMNIGTEFEMRDRLYVDRYEKWASLFPLPPLRRGKHGAGDDSKSDESTDYDGITSSASSEENHHHRHHHHHH